MTIQSSIDQVVEVLTQAKAQGKGCVLLAGAGCSVRAGVPDAAGFVDRIRSTFPKTYAKSASKDYHSLMAALSPDEKKELLDATLRQARLNWAHIALALLMKEQFVDRVLTPSFDRLFLRACGLTDQHPAVYDGASSRIFPELPLGNGSVIYLHGQAPGAVALHTREGFETLFDSLEPVFRDAVSDRPWIVVGYSGRNDPAFKRLARTPAFPGGLFWVGPDSGEPSEHVRDKLLARVKGVEYLPGPDADTFLVTLAQQLGVFPPEFLTHPFSNLNRTLESIAPFPLPGPGNELDITLPLRDEIQTAIERFEQDGNTSGPAAQAIFACQSHLIAGQPGQALQYRTIYDETRSAYLGDLLYFAYILEGNNQHHLAATRAGEETHALLTQAAKQFQAASEIKPEKSQAWFHWGRVLLELSDGERPETATRYLKDAVHKLGKTVELDPQNFQAFHALGSALLEQGILSPASQAEPMFARAMKMFETALAIREDLPETHFALGRAMVHQARFTKGGQAIQLFTRAMKKFEETLLHQPKHYPALTAWGRVLMKQAENLEAEEADSLLAEAQEKFKAAILIQPEHYEAYTHWGQVLSMRGSLWDDENAETLYTQAMEKFQAALSHHPRQPEALHGWGNVLFTLGRKFAGDQAAKYMAQAVEKYREALAIEPHNVEALSSWGSALFSLAQSTPGPEAEKIYHQAAEKFQKVLATQPKHVNALTQWGNVFLELSRFHKTEAKELLNQAAEKYREALAIQPDDVEALSHWGTVLFRLAQRAKPPESDQLYQEAEKKYRSALSLHPCSPEAFNNLGWILSEKAKEKDGKEMDLLFKEAGENFKAAVDIEPQMQEAYLNWGTMLMEQAKTQKGINVHPFLANAKKKLTRAEELRPGTGCYPLARLMSLLANESGCREWLERCKELGTLPERKVWQKEPDFANVCDSKWFKMLIPEEEKEGENGAPRSEAPPALKTQLQKN